MTDQLERFIFEHTAIRGNVVKLNATWRQVVENRAYPPALKKLLGELLAACALLAASLKFKGSLVLQIQGQGPVSLLVVECSSDLGLRATAKWNHQCNCGLPFKELVGDGVCVITLIPEDDGQSYQGIVPLQGDSVAHAITSYMQQSEQLETAIWLAVGTDSAGGLLLQKMPEQPLQDPDDWERILQLAATVTGEEITGLNAGTLLHRLFSEDNIRLFDPRPARFQCSCTDTNVISTLRMLGKGDMLALLEEQGKVEVKCEFCGHLYVFDTIDIEQIFSSGLPAPVGEARH